MGGLLFINNTLTAQAEELHLERVAIYQAQNACNTTEIVSIQASSKRLALSCSEQAMIDIISIQDPTKPVSLNHFNVSDEEELSAVAFHPTKNIIAAAVINKDSFAIGKIQIHDATTGKLLNSLDSGVHPDGLVFSPNGEFLVVANEGEVYRYNGKHYESPEGSVTFIDFKNVEHPKVTQIALADYTNVKGMLQKSYGRTYERVVIGGNSNTESEVPVNDNSPANTEPEFVAFTPDSSKAYVSLQENNGILVIDTASAKIEKVFGLGTTEHLADIKDNAKVQFKSKIIALREPDGITISPDGKYLLTADEGDTNPKASKTLGRKPKGGGRTVSIFDSETGSLIADTGNQLDAMANAAGVYPDGRSDNKGSEPENIISFMINNKLYAAVALERANSIALLELSDPSQPKVIHVVGVDPNAGKQGEFAPEGLAYYKHDGKHFVYSANEKSGTMTVMEVKPRRGQIATN
jgi:DNA-binding beta-propeller fold protein YncE